MATALTHSSYTSRVDMPAVEFPAPFLRWAGAGTSRDHTIRNIAQRAKSPLDLFKLWPDKTHITSQARGSVCTYADKLGSRLVLGVPTGPSDALHDDLKGLRKYAPQRTLAFAAIGPEVAPVFRGWGYAVLSVGAEAIVDLELFFEHTSRTYAIARYVRRFGSHGFVVERREPPHALAFLGELENISAAWRTLPGRRELGFATGAFSRAYAEAVPVHVLRDSTGRALAFVSELPMVRGITGIDLMRRLPEAPGGSIDFLIQHVLAHAHAAGAHSCSLGLAPLAGTGVGPRATKSERHLARVGRWAERAFGFRGLHQFKAKFDPQWHVRYVAVRGGPARVWHAIAALALVINTPYTPN